MKEEIQFIFGIIQSQEPLQELGKKRSRLLDKHTDPYPWVFLFRQKGKSLIGHK